MNTKTQNTSEHVDFRKSTSGSSALANGANPRQAVKYLTSLFLTAALLSPLATFALDFHRIVSVGYDAGGDDLVRVAFVDGETSAVKANQGVSFSLGAMFYNTPDYDWQTQVTAGIKYKSLDSSNGDVTASSYPVEVLEFYNTDMIRFGLGVTYLFNPSIETTGAVGGHNIELDDALGYVAQIGFKGGKRGGFSVDFRYTTIEFSGDAHRNAVREPISDVSGDSAGIYISAVF